MDARDLAERVKAIDKAAKSEPAPNALSLLESLKKAASPTEETLRTTKAGIVLGKLRSHANKDIARAAAEIVSKWKKGISDKSAKPKLASPSSASTPSSMASPATAAPPASSASKPYTGNPELRTYKVDKVDINRTGHTKRDNAIGMMYNGLGLRSTCSIEEVLVKAIEVESSLQSVHDAHKGDGSEYANRVRTLYLNLRNKNNTELRRKVLSGEIAAKRFVTMNDTELKSAEQRKIDQVLESENMKKAQVPMEEKSISDALKCGKCGQKKVSYSQAQTRSADEPMTTFCECTVCGNRWKFS